MGRIWEKLSIFVLSEELQERTTDLLRLAGLFPQYARVAGTGGLFSFSERDLNEAAVVVVIEYASATRFGS